MTNITTTSRTVLSTNDGPDCSCVSESPVVEFDASVKKGVIIRAGEPLKLPAVVTGRPQPEVKWAKDEGELDTDRMIVETKGKNSTLFIKKATRADHGKYQISGTNSSGTKTAETRVDIMGQCSLRNINVFGLANI